MTERGIVREIHENLVVIAPDRSEACFGCMNHEYKTGGAYITAENPAKFPLREGQMVEVNARSSLLVYQAATAILPPALGFLAGYGLTRFFLSETGEGTAAGAGVIFLFACAFAVFRIRKKNPARKLFTVTRVID